MRHLNLLDVLVILKDDNSWFTINDRSNTRKKGATLTVVEMLREGTPPLHMSTFIYAVLEDIKSNQL